LTERTRNDGRMLDEIRPIRIEPGVLPCVHGSAIFTRGQTQALVTLTLGTSQDEQKIDDLEGETYKSFMLHYNFPPFAVGEAGSIRSPGRREVGHGALAERALSPVIPMEDDFPYTIRIVSDILESNGSSSMASVCGASMCLMDGGVPIKAPVAGIAMGLVKEGADQAVLSDISGLEDHLGDMDFKVAGTKNGVTAIQMDIKLTGFEFEILRKALNQAKAGRHFILDKMLEALPESRADLKPFAPRIYIMRINPEKIATVIGPGGKMIRSLTAETGTKIELEDDGTVKISSADAASLQNAVERITALTEEVTVGKDYMGVVRRIEPYGAFIEILPTAEGLLHISRFANYRVREVRDEMNEGDKVLVRVAEIDRTGKVKLTRKELMDEGLVKGSRPPEANPRPDDQDRPPRDNSNRPRPRFHGRGDRPGRNDYEGTRRS
jgi:polyribonucleotide nucleotidyltransferase